MARREPVRREWMPYAIAARDYLGVSPDILRTAINAGKLKAYEKPITRGRKTTDPDRMNHSYFVCLADIDEYVRTSWPAASQV